jgi:methylenetetrahydrofolate dehydrogenase (NADP+) / methenyltetrahydrofolate cyclohydrolase
LLEHYKIDTKGKHAVVIGRSNIVGRPMSILLSRNGYPGNCTVTVCHSHTRDLAGLCQQADIIVAALGRPGFLTADMVKEGAVVIDVGITRVPDATKKSGYAIKGDVDFEAVAPKCSFITPVPGGVGLMTIAALLTNTLFACQQKNKHSS